MILKGVDIHPTNINTYNDGHLERKMEAVQGKPFREIRQIFIELLHPSLRGLKMVKKRKVYG